MLVALLVPDPLRVWDGDEIFHSPQLLALLEPQNCSRARHKGFSWALTWAKGHEAEVS